MSYPSTSPLFFPRIANSSLNSTPAKVPFLPCTFPTNLTVPCILPGTSTKSPTSRSSPSLAREGVKGGIFLGVGEYSSSTFRLYCALASGMVARDPEVSALNDVFRVSGFPLSAGGCKELKDAARLGLDAVLIPLFSIEGLGRARTRLGVSV